MNIQSNKKATNKRSTSKKGQVETVLTTIDKTLVIPEVVTSEVVIPEVANQELMLVNQEQPIISFDQMMANLDEKNRLIKSVVGQLVEDDHIEEVGKEEIDQPIEEPKLTYEQLVAIVEQQANSIEQLINSIEQPKTNQPLNGGLLNTNGNTKADLCRTIWNEEVTKNKGGCPVRAVTIKRFVDEAFLTLKGAPTYYQNMKKAAGFVVSK